MWRCPAGPYCPLAVRSTRNSSYREVRAKAGVHLDQAPLQRVAFEHHVPLHGILANAVEIQRHRIDRVGGVCFEAGIRDLLEHLEDRFDPRSAGVQRAVRCSTGRDQVCGAEQFAVRDNGLEDLGHCFALATVQDVLLLLGQLHLVRIVGIVRLEAGIGACACHRVRNRISVLVHPVLVAVHLVVSTWIVHIRVCDTESLGAATRCVRCLSCSRRRDCR